jgi:hypothetical protein
MGIQLRRRKEKRWHELLTGLENIVSLKKLESVSALIGSIVACDMELAAFLVKALDGPPPRLRLFSVYAELFKAHSALSDLLRSWLTRRPKVKGKGNSHHHHHRHTRTTNHVMPDLRFPTVSRLTFDYLGDATVARFLALCDENVTHLNLANCVGIR